MTDSATDPATDTVKPNFFIIGAPKTGTTALAAYLAEHPQVFFAAPKEPFYWNSDFPRLREMHELFTLDDYLKIFRDANPAVHRAIGEGSTTYMQSQTAVAQIAAFNPQAKFVAMLRNPVHVAHAMHGELRHHYAEDEPDFEKAWALQAERALGRHLPRNDRFVQQLRYQEVATYAPQLKRLFAAVPSERRLVILFDDFVADTPAVYRQTLAFLGLDDDGRTDFPKHNASRGYRLPVVGKLYQAPPRVLERPVRLFRSWYLRRGGWIRPALAKVAMRRQKRTALRPEFAQHLKDVFRDDVAETGALIGRDLSAWTA